MSRSAALRAATDAPTFKIENSIPADLLVSCKGQPLDEAMICSEQYAAPAATTAANFRLDTNASWSPDLLSRRPCEEAMI
jgi:hypothetical protein